MIKLAYIFFVAITSQTLVGQYVAPAGNPGSGGSSSVTWAAICGATSGTATSSCSATGTPTSGGKFVIFYITFATAAPTSSNTTCSNNGTANTWVFQGGNTTTNNISVWDATATNVASGMTFSCTTTQTGHQFGGNILVMNATGSTGIDGSPIFSTAASSASSWTSSSITPSRTGEGIAAVIANANASASMSYSVNNSFSLSSVVDAGDGNVGPSAVAYRGPYASTTALNVTYTAVTGGATDTPNMAIVAYK